MNPVDMINEMTQKMMEQMPEPVRQLSEQAQQQMKTAMHKNLERMNLVSREEFEAQVLLLEKAEARIAALEAKLNDQ
ncbi:MAG: accessory factor UbiK family protein [Pseudomonadales bacterium]|jgi:BMFP domain-containing protein YqiC